MIDIVFLLLIFFLVTYQITEQEKDLEVSVPTTTEGSQEARVANEIVVNLTSEGMITISGEVYTKDELRQKLERIVKASELANVGGADQQPVRISGRPGWEKPAASRSSGRNSKSRDLEHWFRNPISREKIIHAMKSPAFLLIVLGTVLSSLGQEPPAARPQDRRSGATQSRPRA